MKNKNKIMVDYYATKESRTTDNYYNFNYDIIDKIKIDVILSNKNFNENFDVFIEKKDINVIPTEYDLIFFEENMKFYQVKEVEDAGDFYIVNINKYKIQ